DVYVLRSVVGSDVVISVSTTDVRGVKSLNLPLARVLPPIIDIPYERSDFFAKKFGVHRNSFTYKVIAVGCLLLMFVQAFLSVFSATFEKAGLKGFYRRNTLKSLKEADIVVSYSDENFKEAATHLPLNIYWIAAWWSMLFSRTWDVLCAKFFGKRVIMFPNSVGPFRTWFGRSLARLVLNKMDFLLIREPISYEVVEALGVKSPKILTSDTTILLEGSDKDALFESFTSPILGVSPGFYAQALSRKEIDRYILSHAKALDLAIEKFGFIVAFLPHYVSGFSYDDLEVSRLIVERMENKDHTFIHEAKSVERFKSALDRVDLVISSKMHPAVLAVSGGVPSIYIAYDQKQTGFFRLLGLDECVLLIRDFTDEALLQKISSVWGRREEIRRMLMEKVPLLRKKVLEAATLALKPMAEANRTRLKGEGFYG
ncbi:MAG: polysaccharide pyruvyl transferase family protein, partial [Nitrososphaeria archaeon]